MRKTFIDVLTELARIDPKVICVIGDTGFSVFEDFEKEFKERFVNVGIAEQNFVGFGAGLAAMGMKPFIYNVVSFMTYRAFEQIELDICYQENPVVLVGVGGGHAYGTAGPTHHGYFDLTLMTALPNMTVICPADPVEMRGAMMASYEMNKPVYIRIGRNVDPVIHVEPIDFKIGRAIQMRTGDRAAIIATGTMVKDAIAAADILKEKNIAVSVYSMPTIKPVDKECIEELISRNIPIFTVEEHSKNGGLGTAIGNILQEKNATNYFVKLGFPDTFAPVTGTREYLNHLYGISPEGIAKCVEEILE